VNPLTAAAAVAGAAGASSGTVNPLERAGVAGGVRQPAPLPAGETADPEDEGNGAAGEARVLAGHAAAAEEPCADAAEASSSSLAPMALEEPEASPAGQGTLLVPREPLARRSVRASMRALQQEQGAEGLARVGFPATLPQAGV